jgi:hypothetical protein
VTYVAGNAHEATEGLTNRFAGGKVTTGLFVEATTTLRTPTSGNLLTVYWVWLFSSQENAGEVEAIVKLGAKKVYATYLGNPGAFAHWEPETGEPNDPLVLELSGAQKVAVSFTYSERVP